MGTVKFKFQYFSNVELVLLSLIAPYKSWVWLSGRPGQKTNAIKVIWFNSKNNVNIYDVRSKGVELSAFSSTEEGGSAITSAIRNSRVKYLISSRSIQSYSYRKRILRNDRESWTLEPNKRHLRLSKLWPRRGLRQVGRHDPIGTCKDQANQEGFLFRLQ